MSQKILIVDDEEGIRESLKLILGDHYELILTESGIQALSCLDNAPDIGLVLMDIKMPKMNGLEILKEMKARRPDVKVIIVTGYKSVETASEAVNLGAVGYIVKPFKSEEVLEAVKSNLK
ncbi:MAG: response regulator [Candidatus Aceula meridiana]|nr:response regulator [Candidatus Aceula meridiana]